MAVLYDLLAGGPGAASAGDGGGLMTLLSGRSGPATRSRSAAPGCIDPRAGSTAPLRRHASRTASSPRVDARPSRRRRAASCSRPPSSTRTCTCARPGREDEETIATGTAAAAAGGYCAILAMPNTDPVVDSAAVLGALIEQARRGRASIPTGFMASITKGLRGEELTEMAELADAGAAAFTDDGHPVAVGRADAARAAVQRRHRPASSRSTRRSRRSPRDGQMHEGAVSAELGLAGWPSVRSRS